MQKEITLQIQQFIKLNKSTIISVKKIFKKNQRVYIKIIQLNMIEGHKRELLVLIGPFICENHAF